MFWEQNEEEMQNLRKYSLCIPLIKKLQFFQNNRSSHRKYAIKKGLLKYFATFTGKHFCQSLFFDKGKGLRPANKTENLVQLFSCEFCEIFRNIFFYRKSPVFASLSAFLVKFHAVLEFVSSLIPIFFLLLRFT